MIIHEDHKPPAASSPVFDWFLLEQKTQEDNGGSNEANLKQKHFTLSTNIQLLAINSILLFDTREGKRRKFRSQSGRENRSNFGVKR